jgi:L-phenylalanine/L-methionine N-acetyltransferase
VGAVATGLRSLERSDAAAVHAIAAHPEVARRLGGTPYDGEAAWADRITQRDLSRSLAIGDFDGGALRGFLLLDGNKTVRQQHVARLSLAVDPARHRQGIGDRLLGAAIDAADRWMGMLRLELGVQADHTAAVALYQKHGFVVEARRKADMLVDGRFTDGLWMARLRPGMVRPPELGAPPPVPPAGPRRAVTVRARARSDAPALARLHQTDSVLEGTFQLPYQSIAAWEKRFDEVPAGSQVLAAEIDGELAGVCGLFPLGRSPRMRHVAALGMSVDPRFQGCGVGHALMKAVTELADHYLGLTRIELEAYVDNERAQKLYRRHGFEPEGTFEAYAFRRGTYVDAVHMARVRG